MELPNPQTTALELLNRTDHVRPPVDLDRIVALWSGLNISYANLDHAGYLVDLGIHGAEIIVRAQDPPTRRRFTIAHELGHWVLRTAGKPMLKTGIGKMRDAGVEKWCNDFAAALLMPQPWMVPWVVRYLKSAKLNHFIQALLSEPDAYRVSHKAFRIRVSKLTPISIFEFERKDNLILVGNYPSQKVPAAPLSKTLSYVHVLLSKKCVAGQFQHRKTGLIFAIHSFESSQSGRDRWLICIVPETRLQKQMRLRLEKTSEMRKPLTHINIARSP